MSNPFLRLTSTDIYFVWLESGVNVPYIALNPINTKFTPPLKLTWKVIYHLKQQPYFFSSEPFSKQGMSFCCLTERYWSNSKMTSISYNYNTEYTTKWKHSLAWYDVSINSKIKTCILLYKFKLSFVCKIWRPNGLGTRLVIQGSWVRVPLWTRIFHFVIVGFRSLQPELAHANEINHDILRANNLF